MMRAIRGLTLVVVFLAAGLGYLLLATTANWIVVRLLGYQLLWLDAPFLWNALVLGGFVVSSGVAASCVAALTARRALVATYQDLGRLTGSRYTGSRTWGSPVWLILVYGMIPAGTCAFAWFLRSGLRQPRSG